MAGTVQIEVLGSCCWGSVEVRSLVVVVHRMGFVAVAVEAVEEGARIAAGEGAQIAAVVGMGEQHSLVAAGIEVVVGVGLDFAFAVLRPNGSSSLMGNIHLLGLGLVLIARLEIEEVDTRAGVAGCECLLVNQLTCQVLVVGTDCSALRMRFADGRPSVHVAGMLGNCPEADLVVDVILVALLASVMEEVANQLDMEFAIAAGVLGSIGTAWARWEVARLEKNN